MPCGFVLPQDIYRKLLEAESVPVAHEKCKCTIITRTEQNYGRVPLAGLCRNFVRPGWLLCAYGYADKRRMAYPISMRQRRIVRRLKPHTGAFWREIELYV